MSKYPQRVKRGLTVPWGYEQDPDDKQLLLPIEKELDIYEEGKRLIRQGCTLRDVAQWMTAATGRHISHVGLNKKMKAEQSQKRSRAAKIAWDRRRARIEAAEAKLSDEHSTETETEKEA
jgi:hypothetical protein